MKECFRISLQNKLRILFEKKIQPILVVLIEPNTKNETE